MNSVLSIITALILVLSQNPVRIPGPGGRSAAALAPTFVQEIDCQVSGASSVSCVFGANIGVGDAGVVFVGWAVGSGVTISSVSDADGNSYTGQVWASGATSCASNGANVLAFVKPNIVNGDSGTKTITIVFSSAPSFSVAISMVEANGANATSPVDVLDCGPQVSVTTPASPSVTTTVPDFLYAFSLNSNEDSRMWSPGTVPAYTGRGTNGTLNYQETFSQTSAGAVTGNFTVNTSDNFSTAIVALKQ
jgi:hypothetical protein